MRVLYTILLSSLVSLGQAAKEEPTLSQLLGQAAAYQAKGQVNQAEKVLKRALGQAQPPPKNERFAILMRARALLAKRTVEFANLIRLEAGLCMRETRNEVGRAQEVFKFAAAEALRDDESDCWK